MNSKKVSLTERKDKINDFKNKLESELNFNYTNINRSLGAILFIFRIRNIKKWKLCFWRRINIHYLLKWKCEWKNFLTEDNSKDNFLTLSIDNKKAWKVNLYESPNLKRKDDKNHNYLKKWEFFLILLSERFII